MKHAVRLVLGEVEPVEDMLMDRPKSVYGLSVSRIKTRNTLRIEI